MEMRLKSKFTVIMDNINHPLHKALSGGKKKHLLQQISRIQMYKLSTFNWVLILPTNLFVFKVVSSCTVEFSWFGINKDYSVLHF